MRGERSRPNAIRGPIILITVGVLFALNNFSNLGFDKTWPVLLIVIGLLSLMRRGMAPPPPPPPAQTYQPQFNPYPPPPPQQGSYSQSTYSQSEERRVGKECRSRW